ncbi:MAG TPA: fumarate hydratase [Thermodesulfovibrionales bacterium]|nr:fumarate hydratase [Thermodesulfovibrionales bacterium]
MLKLRDVIVELYRQAATSIPEDVETALLLSLKKEGKRSSAGRALSAVLENIRLARESSMPVCQDTGVPIFFVKMPCGVSRRKIEEEIVKATRAATRTIPLRANAVDVITDKNSGDNTGAGFPVVYFYESGDKRLSVDLMLKGSGSENIGQLYKLPLEELKAERDLEGVRKCILDAVYKAQGKGCPPYIIGVGVGATKDQVTRLSKEQLMRTIDDTNNDAVLASLEKRTLRDINKLGIGPMGFGGKTTALAVKIGANHRHPASYFVDVSINCWASRRARVAFKIQDEGSGGGNERG